MSGEGEAVEVRMRYVVYVLIDGARSIIPHDCQNVHEADEVFERESGPGRAVTMQAWHPATTAHRVTVRRSVNGHQVI